MGVQQLSMSNRRWLYIFSKTKGTERYASGINTSFKRRNMFRVSSADEEFISAGNTHGIGVHFSEAAFLGQRRDGQRQRGALGRWDMHSNDSRAFARSLFGESQQRKPRTHCCLTRARRTLRRKSLIILNPFTPSSKSMPCWARCRSGSLNQFAKSTRPVRLGKSVNNWGGCANSLFALHAFWCGTFLPFLKLLFCSIAQFGTLPYFSKYALSDDRLISNV